MTVTSRMPTHGDVLKLMYQAFGILPRKNARFDDFTEKDKKSLQKQLVRLADEEGKLIENYEQAIAAFCRLLAKYLPSLRHADALEAVLENLNGLYAAIVRTECTHLDRAGSVQCFISRHAITEFVLSLHYAMLESQLGDSEGIWGHDPFWYLPTLEHGKRTAMPLEKVIRWAYQQCGMSQRQFHCPGKPNGSDDPAQQQNLDNALKWIRGLVLPSLPSLFTAFRESFIAQERIGQAIEPILQERILAALLYARVATFLGRTVDDTYGAGFLEDVCRRIQQLTVCVHAEGREFMTEIEPSMEQTSSPEEAYLRWVHGCHHHEHFVRQKLSGAAQILFHDTPEQAFTPARLQEVTRKYGHFAVQANLQRWQCSKAFAPPEALDRMVEQGLEIKGKPTSTLEQIDAFQQDLVRHGLEHALSWLTPWLRGVYHYRRDEFEAAFEHYETAFERAKYKAGNLQYKLVNQYVELAAKTDKAVAFKKGIEWAGYIGLEIRWLRKDEPSEERLNFVRAIMKRANYAHQL